MIWNCSTPTVVFRYHLDWEDTAELVVTFSQKDVPILELNKERFAYNDGNILATLLQEETYLFKEGFVCVQIKAKMRDGIISHSNIVRESIGQSLHREVIS